MPTPTEKWFVESLQEMIDPSWQDRLTAILDDFLTMHSFLNAFVLHESGDMITKVARADNGREDDAANVDVFVLKCFLENVQHFCDVTDMEKPVYFQEETDNSIVYVGFVDNFVLVVAFRNILNRGILSMKFEKRIRHLRNLHKSREKSSLYL